MLPITQRALVLLKGTLTVSDRAVLKPKPDELLVKICSAALNPIDSHFLNGFTANGKVPSVLGCDAAGIVQHVGANVGDFQEGDRVFYQCDFLDDRTTSFQQYATIPADVVAKVPSSVSLDEASTFGIAGATAAIGMYHTRQNNLGAGLVAPWNGGRGKYREQPFLVIGGSASVGQFAIQFARLSGFSTIITTSSPTHAEYLKSLGATHVLDRSLSHSELLSEISSTVTPGSLNYAYDAIGSSSTTSLGLDALNADGTLISVIGGGSGHKVGSKTVINVYGSIHIPNNREFGVGLMRALGTYLKDGEIRPNRVELLPNGLGGVEQGLKRLGSSLVSGVKLVARPHETV